jgi:hypothetical protein
MKWLFAYIAFLSGFLLLSTPAIAADWQVLVQRDLDDDAGTRAAHVENESGYGLEIYQDRTGAIHARFSLKKRLNGLAAGHCPTFQVDDRHLHNNSVDNSGCDNQRRWAKFMLGRIEGNRLVSRPVYELMNGIDITFRFNLESGGYEQTQFSLIGSKRALRAILGQDLEVLAD